ncbi:MAG: TonB-dependent receptor [Flavobacteriaceae bacterium]|jgi:hypothetical protein|nr:TonB-dependent receptor [Flavobacteriaceae bacterium]
MQKKRWSILLFVTYTCFIYAQQGITGKVVDNRDTAISDCSVFIQDTDFFTQTDSLGYFTLEVPAGEHTLEYQAPDFRYKSAQVTVLQDQLSHQHVVLEREIEEKEIGEVTITGQAPRRSEAGLISLQKRSVEMTENVSALQLQKQGVGNVAAAVTKATGISRQDGTGIIFVRGLGDRYNSTSLNGLPLPSNAPEYKNIDLSIFKTDVVEYISVEKTFSPKITGDVSGANINIISKEHDGKGYVKIGLDAGVNTQVSSKNKFWKKDGTDFYGFKDTQMPDNPLGAYNFKTSWNWENRKNPFSSGLTIEAGKNFLTGTHGKISLFATFSFDNDYVYSKGMEKSINAQGYALKDLNSQKYEYSTNTTGMMTLAYKINNNNKINYNLLFINSSNQENRLMEGYIKDLAENDTGIIRRAEYEISRLWINQLLGRHNLNKRLNFNWSIAYNNLDNKTPDRQQTTTKMSDLGNYLIFINNSDSDQNRYFDELKDDELAGGFSLDYLFGKEKENKIILGYQAKNKQRAFEATQINFKITQAETKVDEDNYDNFFNQHNFESGLFLIRTFRGNSYVPTALLPSTFEGTQTTHAGFTGIEYKLSDNLTGQAGIRLENVNQRINWDTNLSASKDDLKLNKTKFLPSLNLKYGLNDRNNLRLAFSKTYTMPQYKEIAPFYYEDITEISFGNPYLYPSDNYNADLRWEFFPKSAEVLSITAFGKYIKNPIAKITISSSGNESSYVNIGDWAYVFGAELEVRKDLLKLTNSRLYTFLNATFIESKSALDSDKIKKETQNFINASFDKEEDELQGAAKFLANVNLGYNQKIKDISMDLIVSYAYLGKNIYALSYGTGNLIDQDLHILDLNIKLNLTPTTTIGITAKNLFNPEYKRIQETKVGDMTQRSYDRGRFLGIGFSKKF